MIKKIKYRGITQLLVICGCLFLLFIICKSLFVSKPLSIESTDLAEHHSPKLTAISFNRDVRPILSNKCYACHGPDAEERKADLRLDTEEGALQSLGDYAAITPGKPDSSAVIFRIETEDEDDLMPPPESHLSLSSKEKATLRRWIEEGAKWEGHWAFQPLVSKASTQENKHTIDSFVLKKLKENALGFAPPVERIAWLRRVTQDLTGLPPSLSEIDAFSGDTHPDAYEKVVTRLLQSEDYAERMTTIWLDNARYADSNGYQFDNARTMWPWRDWVIKSYQQNMPYDQFVTEQLAGDLIQNPTTDQLIATGFNRNHGYSIEGGIIDEEYRVMYANDKTTTFGTLFLGLTMDCTRCHDHKFDPLTMADYYSLFAFFNSSAELGAPGEKARKVKASAPYVEHSPAGENGKPVLAMVMKEKMRETRILKQGLFNQLGKKVNPRTPSVLPSFDGYQANRLGLAKWLSSSSNPLFARVTVNRLWLQFFGVGLVKSADNFGMQGSIPSHPELLDWLAVEFRDHHWDLQHMIRLIVLSKTYQQSSRVRDDLDDPHNMLLARGPRFRLAAEQIRDQALAASGLLVRKVGGPSVMPYQPQGVWEDLNAPKSHRQVYVEGQGGDLYRKSLYTYWRRSVPHPAMATFDAPSRDVCAVERISTNTPLQALISLHDPTYIEAARVLAEISLQQKDPLDHAFRSILTRKPTKTEIQTLLQLQSLRRSHYQKNPTAISQLLSVGEHTPNAKLDPIELAALADVCHTIFNLSETITRK